MTLKVAMLTPADVAKAERMVRSAAENELRSGDIAVSSGLFSVLPGTAWLGQCVANWGGHELRCLVAAGGDAMRLGSEGTWMAEVYGCLRRIDVLRAPPTWNYFDSRRRAAWERPGGTGSGDAVFLTSVSFSDDRPTALLASPSWIGGFLVRRADQGPDALPLVCEIMRFHPRRPTGRNRP